VGQVRRRLFASFWTGGGVCVRVRAWAGLMGKCVLIINSHTTVGTVQAVLVGMMDTDDS
jgi:hypothetical protein